MKNSQLTFRAKSFKRESSEHGGNIKNPQKRKRPLGIRSSMHLVLRSSKAKGKWSFRKHQLTIAEIFQKFAKKYHVEMLNMANVGNHIHLHAKFPGRYEYKAFIRAVTAAIVVRVTGLSRWAQPKINGKFWDQRPFSRIVASWREFFNLVKYVEVNRWEAIGLERRYARSLVARGRKFDRALELFPTGWVAEPRSRS